MRPVPRSLGWQRQPACRRQGGFRSGNGRPPGKFNSCPRNQRKTKSNPNCTQSVNEKHGQVAVVTGGTRGDRTCDKHAARERCYKAAVNYAGRRDAADEPVTLLAAAGTEATAIQGEIGTADVARRLLDARPMPDPPPVMRMVFPLAWRLHAGLADPPRQHGQSGAADFL